MDWFRSKKETENGGISKGEEEGESVKRLLDIFLMKLRKKVWKETQHEG